MKHKITTYKFEKTIDNETEIDIPEVPEYHFQTGIRRSIAIIPEWTSWQKENQGKEEEIWKLYFICVYNSFENKIEMTDIQLSQLSERSLSNKTPNSVIDFFLNWRDEYTIRTEEQFKSDYNKVFNNINNILWQEKQK